MVDRIRTSRLSDADPWEVVAQARAQRALIVAGRLITAGAVFASFVAWAMHSISRKSGVKPS